MAVKATAQITLSSVVDVKATYRYYLLQSSTLTKPAKPSTFPPASTWGDVEPNYVDGSTNSLYFVDCTVFCDDTYIYSEVSLSSSYEAAKSAYNKATAAQNSVTTLTTRVADAELEIDANKAAIELRATKTEVESIQIGSRNLAIGSAANYENVSFNVPETTIAGQYDYVITNETYCSTAVARWSGSATSIYSGPYFDFTNELGVTLEIGTVYTVSAWVKADKATTLREAAIVSGQTRIAGQLNVGTAWSRIWVTFEAKQTGGNICFYTAANATSDLPYIYMCGIKVERGNKATDWTPAPEDLSTKKEMEAAIKVESDKITSSVKSTYATKQEVADIDIGGRNLIRNSKNLVYGDYDLTPVTQSGDVVRTVALEGDPLDVVSNLPASDTGYTGLTLTRYGKNLWRYEDMTSIVGTCRATKSDTGLSVTCVSLTHSTWIYLLFRWLPISAFDGKTLTISYNTTPSSTNRPYVAIYYISADNSTRNSVVGTYTASSLTFKVDSTSAKASGCEYIGLNFYANASDTSYAYGEYIDYSNIQIEISDTATDYEPYVGVTKHVVDFGQTVYGGGYDWTSGVLTDSNGVETVVAPPSILAVSGTNTLFCSEGTLSLSTRGFAQNGYAEVHDDTEVGSRSVVTVLPKSDAGYDGLTLTSECKNRFFCSVTRTYTGDGLTFTLTKGSSSFTVNGTATSTSAISVSTGIPLKAGTYTASVRGANVINTSSSMDRFYVQYTKADGTSTMVNNIMTHIPRTFTVDTDTTALIQFIFATGSTYDNQEICIQIEAGTIATDYEPYKASETFTVDFDPIVYGGSYDWTAGVLVDENGAETEVAPSAVPTVSISDTLTCSAGRTAILAKGLSQIGGIAICDPVEGSPLRVATTMPASDTGYTGLTLTVSGKDLSPKQYIAAFGKKVYSGSYNWATGILTDADGSITQLPPQEILAVSGNNTLHSSVGNITVSGRRLIVGSYFMESPNGETEECARFRVSDMSDSFTLSGITTPDQEYALSFWLKSDVAGSLSTCGETFDSTNEWIKHTITFKADSEDIVFQFDAEGTYYIYQPKLEDGNKCTSWSPAPEDVSDEISGVQDAANGARATADSAITSVRVAETTIQQLADSIASLVRDGDSGSLLKQDATGFWYFDISGLQTTVDNTSEDVKGLSEDVSGAMSSLDILNATADQLRERTEYVRSYKDENGQPCLELGEGDSDFKVRITNTEIQFAEGTAVPAKLNRQMLIIEKTMVKGELQFGDDKEVSGVWIWKRRSNGNLGLAWKEVSS